MNVDVRKLERLQRAIAERLSVRPLDVDRVRYVVGLDVAYSRAYGGVAAAVLVDVARGRMVELSFAVGEPPFPYVPGFLAFREAPLLYTAVSGLSRDFDLVMVDGHGLAHPRRAGIASHLGAALSKPSIGVAKRRLVGQEVSEGGKTYVVHAGEKVAVVLQLGRRRLYVSPGHMVDLETAERLVRRLTPPGYTYPLPLHHADRVSKDVARKLDRGTLSPSDLRRLQ